MDFLADHDGHRALRLYKRFSSGYLLAIVSRAGNSEKVSLAFGLGMNNNGTRTRIGFRGAGGSPGRHVADHFSIISHSIWLHPLSIWLCSGAARRRHRCLLPPVRGRNAHSYRPRENQDIDAFGAAPQQRARSGVGCRPRGHDIVDEHQRAALDPWCHRIRHAKRTLQIERPLGARKTHLRGGPLDPRENEWIGRNAAARRDPEF